MRRLLPLALVSALACGGAPPPPAQPVLLPTATATQTVEAPSVDLSPVPVPASLAVYARLSSPSRTLDMLGTWVGTSLDGHEPLAEAIGERLAKLADMTAPIDLAVVFHSPLHGDSGGDIVLSVPLQSLEDAKSAFAGKLVPLSNGAFEILGGAEEGEDDGPSGHLHACAISPAVGAAGARALCSRRPDARDAVMPYLVRTAPRKTFPSDLHVEVFAAPFTSFSRDNPRIIPQIVHSMGGSDPAVHDAFTSAFADLVDTLSDLRSVSFDGAVDPAAASVQLQATFHGSSGLVTRVLTGHPERAEALPAAFLRLPSDSDLAVFGHGMDADQLAHPRDIATRAFDNGLTYAKELKPADRKAFEDAFSHTVDLLAYPFVYARGVDVGPASRALAKWHASPGDAAKERAAYAQVAGWDVFGTQAPKGAVAQAVKQWQAAFRRPATLRWLKAHAGRGGKPPVVKLAAVPSGLPAGTVHLEADIYSTPPAPPAPPPRANRGTRKPVRRARPAPTLTRLHVLVVPDADTTWVVSALDDKLAAARARAMLKPAASGTLASRGGIEALRGARLNAGGLLTMRGLGMKTPFVWAMLDPTDELQDDPLLGMSSASQGSTLLPFTYVESAKGGERSFTMALRVPRTALSGLMNVGPRIFP